MKQYKVHISSLKGIACILVMLGHYLGLIKYAKSISFGMEFLDFLNRIHMGFLVNESFWLQLFFVVSGYLCAHSQIKNFRDFTGKCLCRFLRLAIPILFANVVILIGYYAVGFYNANTMAFFDNSWFQDAYAGELSVGLLLRSPIDTLLFSRCLFNSVYWVLRDMFFASICIYLLLMIRAKLKSPIFCGIIHSILLGVCFEISSILFACLIGATLVFCEKWINNKTSYLIKILIFFMCGLLYILTNNYCLAILLFSCCIIFIPEMKVIKRILQARPFDYLGKVSFGIYVFHWPVICSIGACLLMALWESCGGIGAYCAAVCVSGGITLFLAIIYNCTVERWSSKIVYRVKCKLNCA